MPKNDLSFRTAISRSKLSRPAELFQPYLEGSILDYGCGKGSDADRLGAVKYDPHYFRSLPSTTYDNVLCIYVLNVVLNPEEVIKEARQWVQPGGKLMVACRTKKEITRLALTSRWKKFGFGWETNTGTYQRGFTCEELINITGKGNVIVAGENHFSYVIKEYL